MELKPQKKGVELSSADESVSPIISSNIDTTKNVDISDKEINTEKAQDPNAITVTISDVGTPIVVLFGPGKCGKTMTQIRLARYLHEHGYSVNPIRDFRPSDDKDYQYYCDNYPRFLANTNAASSTNTLAFMLLEVLDKRGTRICQILEAPGEHYYSVADPMAEFPAYINNLISSSTKKIWVITLEPNWNPHANCQQYNLNEYVSKIKKLSQQINRRDKVLFIYNKIDTTNLVQRQGVVNVPQMIKDVKNHFTGVFTPFINTNPITKWWRKYNCDILPFSTGSYNQYKDGTDAKVTYTMGPDIYPQKLWAKISELIRGWL